jgi:hypothetical protein
MTTTEVRSTLPADISSPTADSPSLAGGGPSQANESSRPHRRALARRLPYALVVVALALGYWIGNNMGTSPASPSSKTAEIVTPQQINQALAASSGAPAPTNDRGFSLLENGVQHNHGWPLPVSPSDQVLLDHQMALAQQTALTYPTLADAKAAGMFRAGPFSPGLGTHMIRGADYAYGAGTGVMTDAQIEHPLAWIYNGTKPDSHVVGLFYQSSVPNPAGFAGPNDVWHQHTNICITTGPSGIDAPLGADHDATVAQCNAVGGHLIAATGPLLHVWAVPGYEDPQGVFAHLNPAVTCNDGTYRTVDITKIGTRTSACLDGSE